MPPTLLDRVVVSKMYQQQRWIDGSETAATIGDALAMLKPTLVSELIRLSAGVSFTPQMIQNYNTVRSIVLQSDPGCEFDIALNMDDYGNASSVTSEMAYINSQITVEGFMFDFMGPAYSANPAPTLAAIQYAHSHNQFITGHIWGANSVPPGIDYISTDTDGGLQLRTTLLQNFESEYPSLPVNVEINQNPQNNGTSSYLNGWAEACYYKYMLSDQQKLSYLTSLAQNQTTYHYHFEYPLEFPTCGTFSAYDPLADGSAMVSNILNIMNQYNSS